MDRYPGRGHFHSHADGGDDVGNGERNGHVEKYKVLLGTFQGFSVQNVSNPV
jgi:hypothetical protein